ncbi:MAG: polymer-forming cytoskeletal protein [Phycisphaerales bacterium]|nr:polymer-forming cytoskeletal protein [Phycisphaerales bacterium]
MTTAAADQTTTIAIGAHFKGELTFEHDVHIQGGFEGRIVSGGEVVIAQGAACKASIMAVSLRIEGEVEGDITARDLVQLGPEARMTGDISAPRLLVADGASFLGHCRIGPESASGDRVPRAANPPARPVPAPAPVVRSRGAEIETRTVEVARARLAEAQAKLARISGKDPAAA